MQTYDYSPDNKDIETIKKDYLFLLRRSLHQKAFDDYNDKYLEEFISIIKNIPGETFKIKLRSIGVHDMEREVTFAFKILAGDEDNWFSFSLKDSTTSIIHEIEKYIFYIFEKINTNGLDGKNNILDNMIRWEKRISEFKKEFEVAHEYLQKKSTRLCLLAFRLQKTLYNKIKARENRATRIEKLERTMSKIIYNGMPEVGEKIIPSWTYYGDTDYRFNRKLDSEILDNLCTFCCKEGDKYVVRDKNGKKKKIKYIQRYLPFVKGFEELNEFIA